MEHYDIVNAIVSVYKYDLKRNEISQAESNFDPIISWIYYVDITMIAYLLYVA